MHGVKLAALFGNEGRIFALWYHLLLKIVVLKEHVTSKIYLAAEL